MGMMHAWSKPRVKLKKIRAKLWFISHRSNNLLGKLLLFFVAIDSNPTGAFCAANAACSD